MGITEVYGIKKEGKYERYFQKSGTFLFPLLGIKRKTVGYNRTFSPIKTYLSVEGISNVEERRLCCVFQLENNKDFLKFEQEKLTNNNLFDDFVDLENGKGLYLFDFNTSRYKNDYDNVVNGSYSKLTQASKKIILEYFKNNDYITHYLYPDKFYQIYSDILGVDKESLEHAVELTDMPDSQKEHLILNK